MKRPWMKFYPNDWRGEPRLRMCSLAARGLWIDLMSYMHEGQPYGHLTIEGTSPDIDGVAALVSRPVREVRKALAELEAKQVFSRTVSGVIFSRRMVRDQKKAERDQSNGRDGGNPKLRDPPQEGVNPPDKAQKPDTRSQREDAALNAGEANPKPVLDLNAHRPAWLRILAIIGDVGDEMQLPGQHGRVAQWLADWDLELDILPTVERMSAQRRRQGGSLVRSLSFFEGAIADAHAKRIAPIPLGVARAPPQSQIAGGFAGVILDNIREAEHGEQSGEVHETRRAAG